MVAPVVVDLVRMGEQKTDPMEVDAVVDGLNDALALQLRSRWPTRSWADLTGFALHGLAAELRAFAHAELDDARHLVEKVATLGGAPALARRRSSVTRTGGRGPLAHRRRDRVHRRAARRDPAHGQEALRGLEHRLEHLIMRKQEQVRARARRRRPVGARRTAPAPALDSSEPHGRTPPPRPPARPGRQRALLDRLRQRRLVDLLRARPRRALRARPHAGGVHHHRHHLLPDRGHLRRGHGDVPGGGRVVVLRPPRLQRVLVLLRRLGPDAQLHDDDRHLGVLRPALPRRPVLGAAALLARRHRLRHRRRRRPVHGQRPRRQGVGRR